MIVEGAISTKAALFNGRRRVECVYIDEDKVSRDVTYILNYLNKHDIRYQLCKREYIDSIASGKTHGGIIAEVSSRKYDDISKLKDRTVFLIDGVEDPFNLGYIFRTLRAFNYHQVIMPSRDLSNMESSILKSSAGAFDELDIIMSDDLYRDLLKLKDHYKLLSLSRSDKDKDIMTYHFPSKKIILLGGEKRGIKKDILKISNEEIFIDYPGDFRNALNASSALSVMTAVLEMRKRNGYD